MAFDEADVRAKLGLPRDGVGTGRAPMPRNGGRASALATEKPAKKDTAQAETKLRMAGEMEKRQNAAAAVGYYKEIVTRFPDSPQAKIARGRLKVLQVPQ